MQEATALDKDLALGGKGEPVSALKQDPWLVTKSERDKITLEEKLCAFTQYNLVAKANQI